MKGFGKRLFALVLALGMLVSMLPAALLEEALPVGVDVAPADEAFADEDPAPEEEAFDLCDLACDEPEAVEEVAEPADEADDALPYALLTAPAEAALADDDAWPLPEGFAVLVLEADGERAKVAFGTDAGAVEGTMPLAALHVLDAGEREAFLDELARSGGVTLYGDTLDYPLPIAPRPEPAPEEEPVPEEPVSEEPAPEEDPVPEEPAPEEEPEEPAPEAEEPSDLSEEDPDDPGEESFEEVGEIDLDEAEALGDAEGLILEDEEESTFVVDTSQVFYADAMEMTVGFDGEVDDAEMYAGYAERFFYGDGRAPLASTNAGEKLSGANRKVYDAVKAEILKIAAGSRTSSIISIRASQVTGKTVYTPADLGVTLRYNADGTLTADSINAMYNGIYYQALDLYNVANALWHDCPYELYWADKYQNAVYCRWPGFYLSYDSGYNTYVVKLDTATDITFEYYVMKPYRRNGSTYEVDAGKINTAKQAAANARAIVNRYEGYSDYAKLYAYAAEIANLTDYNYDALSDSWDKEEQNAQFLIWVFDNDPNTKVVCEGYAHAFQYLCELSRFSGGVRSYMVEGDTIQGGGGGHAWNIVRMDDGRNYLVDVTWMDTESYANPAANLLAWIESEKGGLFLVGANSGSVSGGYTVGYRTGGGTTWRSYWEETSRAYPSSALTLASGKYVPRGFMKIGSGTYYFDNGKRVKSATLSLNGMNFRFDANGVLTSGWAVGWQTINGQRLYFDQNGLHTAHTAVADPAEAATCTRAGKTAGSHCSVCGEVLTAQQTIPATGHKGVTVKGKAATCTAAGLTDGSRCSVCGVTLTAQKSIPATGHRAVTVKGRAATCTAAGLTDGSKCANCGVTLTAQRSIPARGHTPVTVKGHAAGYTHTGLTDGKKCSTCGAWITAQKTIPKVYIRYIDIADLKNGTVTLAVGEKAALSLSFERRYGVSTQYFTYTPKKVQFVDNNELSIITGVAEGKGKITVYTDNKKVKAKLTIQVVDPYKPAGISINQGKTVTLTMGQRLRLGTTLSPASARATLTWKSSKPKVATVDASGNVVPVGEGKAKITVTTHNKKKATITVVVVDPYKPLGISINQGKTVTLKVGQTLRLGASLNPASARSALTWKSKKPAIATVDGSGLVRAVKKGKTKVTVTTYNKKKATITIVVTE